MSPHYPSKDTSISHWLLLPGLMCDHSFWQPLLERRTANLPCVVADYGDASSIWAMAREWVKGTVRPEPTIAAMLSLLQEKPGAS